MSRRQKINLIKTAPKRTKWTKADNITAVALLPAGAKEVIENQ